MFGRIAIFGYGAVGRALTTAALAQGREVVVAQRRRPDGLPPRVGFVACDALEGESVLAAARGAEHVVLAIGFAYDGALWRKVWPQTIRNFVAASETTGSRVVYIDNLYMYGPQTAPLVETMPLTGYGAKPAARATATRIWMEAAAAGRTRFAALRAPDFYGPLVGLSYLGDTSIAAMAKGKAAMFIGTPDMPHDYAYVPDFARAALSLIDAPDSAYGQAWHVPCAPTRTTRELLQMAADALGVKLRLNILPAWLLKPASLFSPFLGELPEMRFTWDRPYRVDASKFAKAFWSDPTPFAEGIPATAHAFREAARR
jgi:nucleoside-diphosphate-sugar epimerase